MAKVRWELLGMESKRTGEGVYCSYKEESAIVKTHKLFTVFIRLIS